MKDIKKHLDDFCWIMCQFEGETWNTRKCFWNGVKLQMTAETEACLRLKPWNRCWSSGWDTFCSRRSKRAGLSVSHRGQTSAELPLANLPVTVLQGCARCTEQQRGATVSRRCTINFYELNTPKALEQWTAYWTGMEWAFSLSGYSHDVEERPDCWSGLMKT